MDLPGKGPLTSSTSSGTTEVGHTLPTSTDRYLCLAGIPPPVTIDGNDVGPGRRRSRQHDDRPTPAQWERIRIPFTTHYKQERKPLPEVMAIMAEVHQFEATAKMFKQRVKTWGLQKYKPTKGREASRFMNNGAGSRLSTRRPLGSTGDPTDLRALSRYPIESQLRRRRRRSSSSLALVDTSPVLEDSDFNPNISPAYPSVEEGDENSLPPLMLSRMVAPPEQQQYLEAILVHIDRYYKSSFLGQGRMCSKPLSEPRVVDVDDEFTDMGLRNIHDPGYTAISMAKARQYRAARIFLGETQDRLKDLLVTQHPSLVPFVLEIICEDSTTPEFNVSEWFRQHVYQLCAIILGKQHSLTLILQLLGMVGHKLEICARILSKIQAVLSLEFGATKWEARRPLKVYCRVLRHLGRYDEVEQILPTVMGDSENVETPTQSEMLGLLYERAWLNARGRHDNQAATSLFVDILRLTDGDAQEGQISIFRIKALRGLGVLAREDSRHDISQQYFLAAFQGSRRGFGRMDSNTVRIGSELEEELRTLGRDDEADELRKERDELFARGKEAIAENELRQYLLAMSTAPGQKRVDIGL